MSFITPPPQNNILNLRFGGGVNTRTSEDEIDLREAADGFNFNLDLENTHLEPRMPFKKLGQATNTSDIRGFAQLIKQDGTTSALIQAGTTVYEWDGASGFTSKGTVSATAQLRGHMEHNYPLDDKVFITDLNLQENVKEWDGTTFQDMTHDLGGNLKAKYAAVTNERLWLGNVIAGTTTPHLIAACKQSNTGNWSTADKPSSSLGADDPFYMLTPDLRPINGMVEAFGRMLISGEHGAMHILNGSNATDFDFDTTYARSAATGNESMTFAGNDVIYGRAGTIETLAGSEAFGDVENDDISRDIADVLKGFAEFRLIYNSRTKRLFVFPDGSSDIWVFHKSIHDQAARDVTLLRSGETVSPWVKWKTDHTAGFQPTTAWTMLDPSTKLQKVYFGDSDGNIYEMESETYDGDGATTDVAMEWLSKTIRPQSGTVSNVSGKIRYRAGSDITFQLVFEFGGDYLYNQEISLTLPAGEDVIYFGGDQYFNETNNYFGSLYGGRIATQPFSSAGLGSEFQVRAKATSSNDYSISEIIVEFDG